MSAGRVYITGAAGLIGKEAVRAFVRAGWTVSATDMISAPSGLQLDRTTWGVQRVEDITAQTLEGFDAVVHLAALTLSAEQKSFGASADLPDARTMLGANVLGTEALFRAAAAASLPAVVYASTAAVYGRPQFHTHLAGGTVERSGPFRPTSLYAHTKLMCEGLADFYAEHSESRFIGIRPTFSYGLGRLSGISGMFAAWIVQAIRGEAAVLGFPFGQDGQLQLIYAKDMAQTFVDAAVAGRAGRGTGDTRSAVYNSPTRQCLSMKEIASIVRDCTGNSQVRIAEGPFTPQLQMPTMSTVDAFETLGSEQRYPLAQAVADMARDLEAAAGSARNG